MNTKELLQKAEVQSIPKEDRSFLQERERLARMSKEAFGYGILLTEVENITHSNMLRDVLSTLGIHVYNPDSVAKYKKAKLRELNFYRRLQNLTCKLRGWSLLTLGVLCFAIIGLSSDTRSILTGVVLAVGLAIVVGITVMLMADQINWNRVRLSWYPDPVPEFALSRALEIKEKMNQDLDVKEGKFVFYVEYLGKTLDPFLIVQAGDEEFYIAVWDEPKFEAVEG